MTWKDEYREQKEQSGLTWDEFVDREMLHVSELGSATRTLERLDEHVRACRNEYQQMRRELQEVRILMESEEFGE